MSDNLAPLGKTWFCMMCGKTSPDQYGEAAGWDESCMLNSVLVNEGENPTSEQAKEFNDERARYLSTPICFDRDPLEDDPELLAAAKAAIERLKGAPPTGQSQGGGGT